jgi:3-oxoadipate enol-lactonase
VKPRPFTYHASASDGTGLTLPGLRHLSIVERPALAELVHARLAGAELPDEIAASCGCAEVRA